MQKEQRKPLEPLKKKKKRNCLLLTLQEIFFICEMWSPLSGGHLHCKLGAIWIRHHGATCGWKSLLCRSRQYTEVPFWAAQHTTVCLDKSRMHAFGSLLTHTEQNMQRAENFQYLPFHRLDAEPITHHTHTHTHTHTRTHTYTHTYTHTIRSHLYLVYHA